MWQGQGVCLVGCMHGRGHVWHAWQGSMCGGGDAWKEGHVAQGGVPGRYYEIWSMSGRYASYWNAFLLI